jgi:hypothetical protein
VRVCVSVCEFTIILVDAFVPQEKSFLDGVFCPSSLPIISRGFEGDLWGELCVRERVYTCVYSSWMLDGVGMSACINCVCLRVCMCVCLSKCVYLQ